MNTLNRRAAIEMGSFLSEQFSWQLMGTFTTEYLLSLKSARRIAERLHAAITNQLPQSRLISFWVAERGLNTSDYHLHILFSSEISSEHLARVVENSWISVSRIKGLSSKNRYVVEPFQIALRGCSYITKRMTQTAVDYDFILPS